LSKFTDMITVRVRAGKGGAGCVSFRREKYIPKGGPDGGDGGKGGDVSLEASPRYYNLSHLFPDRLYRAEDGKPGMGNNRHGKDGKDLTVYVPPGTQVIDGGSGDLLSDLVAEGDRILVARGGRGGRGNAFFKSSTNQAPRYAQPGVAGEERCVSLNLKLIADVGLVGLPNAGKSTLLSRLTNANPKIADYPFTTLIPNLGVVQRRDETWYTIADIPGIIEGAHRGHGLGLSFLMHIERVKVLLFTIDITDDDFSLVLELLRSELREYSDELLTKPCCVVLTKADLVGADEVEKRIDRVEKERSIAVSALRNVHIEELYAILDELLEMSIATE